MYGASTGCHGNSKERWIMKGKEETLKCDFQNFKNIILMKYIEIRGHNFN